ncbi:uncharacterized protein [Miscanthus floridulus]|uniref:uncharacterized protein n=1 Tax=Miscanthus floridulus TaxID=154761 RepID=UPI00345829A3
MDGDSSLNIMYAKTLDAMGIDRACIRLTGAPFHGIVAGKQVMPLGKINVPLKMIGPCRVITISTSFQCAYECKVKCCEHATAIVASKELVAIRKEVVEEAPDPKQLARSFEPVEGTKEFLIDPNGSKDKAVRIGTMLSSE